MWNRYKILTLPCFILLAGLFFLVKGEDLQHYPHSMEKGNPFPPDQGTKTEYNIQSCQAKVSRSYTPIFFTNVIIELKTSFTAIYIPVEKELYNSYLLTESNKDRAPPKFS